MIETPRLLLRPWRESDREPFYRMNSDPRVMDFFPATLTREGNDDLIGRCEAHLAEHGFTFFATELRATGEFIGFIGLARTSIHMPFPPSVEIGWRLAFEHWNHGYATEGARAAMDYGFRDLGLDEIVSFTAVTNTRSRHVMEKLAMSHNPMDDFEHPRIAEGHPLRRHVLYRARNPSLLL